jgi:predicted amidohydrolase YtcJ
MRADFVFIDIDPLFASPAALRNAAVLETWIGGEKVFEAARQSRDEGR